MTRITWRDHTSRHYEAGVDRGVIYPTVGPGLPWSGLLAVEEKESNSDIRIYLDGQATVQRKRPGNFEATIEAIDFPLVNQSYSGLMSPNVRPMPMGLSYRVGSDRGYKIHIVYNALLTPSGKDYVSTGSSVSPTRQSWGVTTRPIPLEGYAAVSHIVVDTAIAHESAVAAIEEVLYGGDISTARLPTPDEVVEIFESHSILRITDNGDGTWTADGPDSAIQMLDAVTFEIDWPSAVYISETAYTIESL